MIAIDVTIVVDTDRGSTRWSVTLRDGELIKDFNARVAATIRSAIDGVDTIEAQKDIHSPYYTPYNWPEDFDE